MRRLIPVLALSAAVAFWLPATSDLTAQTDSLNGALPQTTDAAGAASDPLSSPEQQVRQTALARLEADTAAMQRFSPAYPFWYHVFTVPDGSVAFGSAATGRLLVTFPTRGNWMRNAVWADPSAAGALAGARLPTKLNWRRQEVASLLETLGDEILHNQTRGLSLQRNAERYGAFLSEWGAIYERFGVPAEIGLAQAAVESGLNGTVRSRARALGFCQWLQGNWNSLKRLAPHVIEGHNQTTQAPYCAAYLTILATKYGSFIPALSEHHAGGVNVGRTLVNGERLGGAEVRERYFLGASFARDLRTVSLRTFRDLYRTFGPRSALYSDRVFGNMANIERLRSTMPQADVFAMRTPRARSLADIARVTGLPTAELRRFNPALIRQVPADAILYLPQYVEEFGPDVSFWHHPPSEAYASVLNEFLQLNVPLEKLDAREFDAVLQGFRTRFEATETEEGSVMATTLAFVLRGQRSSRQAQILAEFRTSPRILRLFERGRVAWSDFLAGDL